MFKSHCLMDCIYLTFFEIETGKNLIENIYGIMNHYKITKHL